MGPVDPSTPDSASPLSALTPQLRRQLHRHCARMTGSFFDGEDVVQEALLKAHAAYANDAESIDNPAGWLFRIAHHTALDFIRRRQASPVRMDDTLMDAVDPKDEASDAESRWAVSATFRTFLSLTPAQRGAVILADVLGHSLEEVSAMTERSLPATKSALFRGRQRLRELATAVAPDTPPAAPDFDAQRLEAYADLFNAREFGALGAMLAEEVRVDLVGATAIQGKANVAERYFGNYARASGWAAVAAVVDGRSALVISQGKEVRYAIELVMQAGRVIALRDFRHAGYDMQGAQVTLV